MAEMNRFQFYGLYRKEGRVLHTCPSCGSLVRTEYYPGYGVRLSCRNGCGVVTRKWKGDKSKTELEHAVAAVDAWNNGEVDQ